MSSVTEALISKVFMSPLLREYCDQINADSKGNWYRVAWLISNVYMAQSVKVRLNRRETRSVKIGRGVRQGCCLSPVLFHLYSECLAKEALEGFGDFKIGGLKFPLNGLRAQSSVSPVAGLLPLASGPACLETAFPPFLVKQLYHCDSVVISSFVRTGFTTRFSTPAVRYTLKSLIWNCRSTQKYLWQKHKMDSERNGHARTQQFALNY